MPHSIDGPVTESFHTVPFRAERGLHELPGEVLSKEMSEARSHAPSGDCTSWGIPFRIGDPLVLVDEPKTVALSEKAQWFVILHTSDRRAQEESRNGFLSPMRGRGQLGEHAADYIFCYEDGTEERAAVRRRHQIGAFQRIWGENCFEAVPHRKPRPVRPHHEQPLPGWGSSQTRASAADFGPWINWLWAWKNPHPAKTVTGIRFEPKSGVVLVFAVSAGKAGSHPLRWETRRKAVLHLEEDFRPALDDRGLLAQIQLDMGQIISAAPRPLYPHEDWDDGGQNSYNNKLPEMARRSLVIEYTAHRDACFHLANGERIPLAGLTPYDPGAYGAGAESPPGGRNDAEGANPSPRVFALPEAARRVAIRVVEEGSGKPTAVKLHLHGIGGEYLAPIDRHRIPNPAWFEDYSVDFVHGGKHYCTYIPGETRVDLPLGKVFIEISKGFEIRPVRKVVEIKGDTEELEIPIGRALPWREKGWVTADTHVHFLSPMSALLEGSAEGVNVVNLLASQWGELMTNVGDFDGRTTWGSREAGGDGEYLVRVGTENRQHVMGHISLLGYDGSIIARMTTGGADESALGDPIEVLLTEWARQCRKQGGVVILPHFPNPRAEHAASIVSGDIDGIEMTSWGDLYSGINPYSLADWYRYLNCGYHVAAVGGTDKMSAGTAVGTVRTYARIDPDAEFDYRAWMEAVRRGETFVTYGPLLEFHVDGKPMGSRIRMSDGGRPGGKVDVEWKAASVTVPMSTVELVVNGEIRESATVDPNQAEGHWSVKLDRSSWLALLVRGRYPGKTEMVAAHSSAVLAETEGSAFYAEADALTILEQIEGAMAYLDTVGTRAETAAYKRMRLVLEGAHRQVHNRMHAQGYFHEHTVSSDHPEHH